MFIIRVITVSSHCMETFRLKTLASRLGRCAVNIDQFKFMWPLIELYVISKTENNSYCRTYGREYFFKEISKNFINFRSNYLFFSTYFSGQNPGNAQVLAYSSVSNLRWACMHVYWKNWIGDCSIL